MSGKPSSRHWQSWIEGIFGKPGGVSRPHAPRSPVKVPPGFDGETYLALHPDVARIPGIDPAWHYTHSGQSQLRALLAPGVGLVHPESRMFTAHERSDWLTVLRARAKATHGGLAALLRRHPRAAWLETGFTLPAYMVACQDVIAATAHPLEVAFHYLETGLEEGRSGRPETWDSAFVQARYGITPDADASPVAVLRAVLATGVSALDAALTEAELWERAGLCGSRLTTLFDHEYYHAMAARAGSAPDKHDRLPCIVHFLEIGAQQGLPVNPDTQFDAAFYAALEPVKHLHRDERAAEDLTDADLTGSETGSETGPERDALYTHWLGPGLRAGLSPNARHWVAQHFGIGLPDEIATQLPLFQLAAGIPAQATPDTVLTHLMRSPRPALTALDLSAPAATDFIVALADQLVVLDDEDQAEWLYWSALRNPHHHGMAPLHLADLLQRKGRLEQVEVLRTRMATRDNTPWNTLLLAELYLTCQQFDQAANSLNALPDSALADVAIAQKHRSLAHQLFWRIWNDLERHVAAYGVTRTQSQIAAALRACTPRVSAVARPRQIRHVALVGSEDLYQCKFYRIDQKADQLRAAGIAVTVFSPTTELDTFKAQLDDFDAVIFFRVPAFPPMIDTMIAARVHGLLTVYELDDLIFDAEHFPPPLDTYAGQITALEHATMACGVPLYAHAMKLCDFGIGSTPTITEQMGLHMGADRVFLHNNALSRIHMRVVRTHAPARAPDAPLVIFYGSGTRAHKEGFHEILEPALARILHRHPGRIEIRLTGMFAEFNHLDLARDPVQVLDPVWDFEDFIARVA